MLWAALSDAGKLLIPSTIHPKSAGVLWLAGCHWARAAVLAEEHPCEEFWAAPAAARLGRGLAAARAWKTPLLCSLAEGRGNFLKFVEQVCVFFV